MKTLPRKEADELFDEYWDELTTEWFKVEVLQDYTGEDDSPSLQSWLAGNKKLSTELMKSDVSTEWIQTCQEKLKKGVSLIRIHIVEEPHTPYIEWELEHYRNINMALCGEQVYLVKKSDVLDLKVPKGDMMFFDDKRVVVNSYDDRGLMISQTFYDESDDIAPFLVLKKQIMQLAKPL